MRRALGITLLIVLCAAARAQNPHDEGVQAGQNAQGVISGFINQGSATAVLPPGYYNANPPQTSLYGSPSLSGFTAAQIAYCKTAAAANDVTCQAISTALSSAATPRPPVLATDPAVTTANAVANNPAAQGVTLSGVYSACTTQTNQIAAAQYDLQSCNNYYLRSIDNACQKNLTVDVTWQCPPGAIAGPTRTIDSSGAAKWICKVQTTQDVYTCPAGWDGPSLMPLPPDNNLGVGCFNPASGQRQAATLTTVTTDHRRPGDGAWKRTTGITNARGTRHACRPGRCPPMAWTLPPRPAPSVRCPPSTSAIAPRAPAPSPVRRPTSSTITP